MVQISMSKTPAVARTETIKSQKQQKNGAPKQTEEAAREEKPDENAATDLSLNYSSSVTKSREESTTKARILSQSPTKLTVKDAAKSSQRVPNEEDDKNTAPWFIYLMIQLGGSCKNEAKVIVAREVFADAYRHNTGEINDKGTKAAKGAWTPEIVAGPFPTWQAAERGRKLCMEESRGIVPRRDRIIKLVSSGKLGESVVCFDKRCVPVNLNHWLENNNMTCLQLPTLRLAQLYQECA
jgi:hypothetical protein